MRIAAYVGGMRTVLFLLRFLRRLELALVRKGDVAGDHAVVQIVDHPVLQVLEELVEIDGTADAEPEGADRGNRGRDDQMDHQKVGAPPLAGPLEEEGVAHRHHQKRKEEFVDETEDEESPRNATVALAVFGGDSDDLAEHRLEIPGFAGLVFTIEVVDAPVEHTVQIEGLLAGEFRDHDVEGHGDDHDHGVDLVAVDGELHRVHLPHHDGIEGA